MTIKKIIGIISVPITPGKKYFKVCGDSYISSTHLTWLKSQNIEVLVIPYDTKNLKYYFKKVHGLYFPSGGVFAGTQLDYYNCCKNLFYMAIEENNKGNYFPIWGCCMGFQQMIIIADGNDNLDTLLTKFDSYNNLFCKIKLTNESKNTNIINGIDQDIIKTITTKKSTLNNHKLGISPIKFRNNKKLHDFFYIVGTSKDRKNKEFVAIIEARKYPFYAVQWHPEGQKNEMITFIKFFANELKKNNKRKLTLKNRKNKKSLYTKKIDCYDYSGGLYKQCNFFWHKKTSAHNKNLCNIAQIGKKFNGV